MFTVEERDRIRSVLVVSAGADADVTGAAIVGSGATGSLDRWSDIDLVLQLAPEADEQAVVDRWTALVRDRFGLADLMDVVTEARYRVFLLPSSLQIDISFWPHDRFRATNDGFQLLFGEANAPTPRRDPDASAIVGMAWLYALHARSAIERDRPGQALLMLDGLRDRVVTLQCLRTGRNPWHGRGIDRLPAPDLADLAGARARSLDIAELARSKRELCRLLLAEVRSLDPVRGAALAPALAELAT